MSRIKQWLASRYGVDALSWFLLICSVVVYILSIFMFSNILNFVFIFIALYNLTRIFSRNYVQRDRENRFYLRKTSKIRSMLNRTKMRKTHRLFKCPTCKQIVRIPKGKGDVVVHCPKCKTAFDAHS